MAKKKLKKSIQRIMGLCIVTTMLFVSSKNIAHAETQMNLSGKITASSEDPTYPLTNAIDSNTNTIWQSNASGVAYLLVDMGGLYAYNGFLVNFTINEQTDFEIYGSNSESATGESDTNWTWLAASTIMSDFSMNHTAGVSYSIPIGQYRYYKLKITQISDKAKISEFKLYGSPVPTISGVTNNGLYNVTLSPTFSNATATLQRTDPYTSITTSNPYLSSTPISGEGAYVLTVTNAFGISSTVNFTIDKCPPAVGGDISDNGLYTTDVKANFTEGTATVSKNGGTAVNYTSNTIISEEGTYVLIVKDNAGNPNTIHFTIDKTAPTGTLSINNGDTATTSKNVTLSIAPSDGSGSGVSKMRFSNDGTNWSAWESISTSKNWTIPDSYGTATVYMQLKDKVEKISDNISDTITYKSIPALQNSTKTADEDTNISLSSSDFKFTNADGSGLNKVMLTELPQNGVLELNGTPVVVSQEILASELGNLVFRPNVDWNGTTVLKWKGSSDGTNYSTPVNITFNINPINDAPIATSSNLSTIADTSVSGTLSASDVDKDNLTYSIVSNGTKGTAIITNPSTGEFIYTPNEAAYGTDSFTFRANDGTTDSLLTTINVTIAKSANADLKTLHVNAGTLTPAFDKAITDYNLNVTNNIDAISVTSSVYSHDSKISINGDTVTDTVYGTVYTKSLSLNVGLNTITLEVTAQDGGTKKTYTLNVRRDGVPTGTIFINNNDTITNSKNVNLSITSADVNGSGISKMRFSNDGINWSAWEDVAASKNWMIANKYGIATVYMQLKDNKGNVSNNISDTITYKPKPTPSVILYNVIYNGNGNTEGYISVASVSYQQGATASVLGNTGNLAKTGYTFAGWNTKTDGTGINYTVGSQFVMGNSDMVLYANWTKKCIPNNVKYVLIGDYAYNIKALFDASKKSEITNAINSKNGNKIYYKINGKLSSINGSLSNDDKTYLKGLKVNYEGNSDFSISENDIQ